MGDEPPRQFDREGTVQRLYERIVGGELITNFDTLRRDCLRFVEQELGGYERVIRSWHTKDLQDDRVLAIVATGNDRCVPRCRDQRALAQLARTGDWWARQAAMAHISDENEILKIYTEQKEFRFQRLAVSRLAASALQNKIPSTDILLSNLLTRNRALSEGADRLSISLTFEGTTTIGQFRQRLEQNSFEIGTALEYQRNTHYRLADLHVQPTADFYSWTDNRREAWVAYWAEEDVRRGTVVHKTSWDQTIRSGDRFDAQASFYYDVCHLPADICEWCHIKDPLQIRAAMRESVIHSAALRVEEPDLVVPNGRSEAVDQLSWHLSLRVPASVYNDGQARKVVVQLLLLLDDLVR